MIAGQVVKIYFRISNPEGCADANYSDRNVGDLFFSVEVLIGSASATQIRSSPDLELNP